MHVLMPVTGPGTGHPQHFSRLFHHPAYATGTGNPSSSATPMFIDIAGSAIDLSPTGSPSVTLPANIVNLSSICGGKKVDPNLLQGSPQDPVVARVSMRSGKLGTPNDGLIWDLDGTPHELASLVTWTISGIPGSSLTLPIGGVNHTFHAISNVLELLFFNAPMSEIPDQVPLKGVTINCPPPGQMAHHFLAFFDILRCTGHSAPKFLRGKYPGQCGGQSVVPQDTAAIVNASGPVAFGVSPVTCMLGGGDGGP
jgi:hypothetical protein